MCIRDRSQPVEHVLGVAVEELRVVLGEVGLGGGNAPLERTLVGLHFTHENLEQGGHGKLVFRDKADLVALAHDERYVVQYLYAVDGLGNALDLQNVLAGLARCV